MRIGYFDKAICRPRARPLFAHFLARRHCGLQILDTGIAFEGPDAYFRKGWNWLDFTLLAAQSLDLLGIEGMKALRVLRVLRSAHVT